MPVASDTQPAGACSAAAHLTDNRLTVQPPSACAEAVELGRRLAVNVALALGLIITAMAAVIIIACRGHLIYSLDDPYISLSLGWHIAHGEYGVNAGEAASPASSILYPLLLAGFAWTRWQQWVPAAGNALAALGTGALLANAVCRYGIITRSNQLGWGTLLVVALCIAVNTVGLVFVGLEHSLHVLISVYVVLALARALDEDRVPPSLVAAIVLLPLLRFEGAALGGLALAALMAAGHRRAATIGMVAIATTIGAYMAAMQALGLPLLPSSVLRKSDVAVQAVDGSLGLIGSILRNARANIHGEAAPVLLLIAIIVARPMLRAMRSPLAAAPHVLGPWREWLFAAAVAGALAAQVVFGAWGGGFARYEAYALALGAAAAIVLWGRTLGILIARDRPLINAVAALVLLCLAPLSLIGTVLTPTSALGVYEMQYQMRRLAIDFYRQPVAVIDLGLVSYRNPYYVLDLWGLGSETVRRARSRPDGDLAWLDRLVAARRVGLAMVYDNWFAVPAGWHRLGALSAAHRPSGYATITFYATSQAAVADAVAALDAFSRTTGTGTHVTLLNDVARLATSTVGSGAR